MTLIAFCILFVCKVSVRLKGRRETMRRTSRRTFKLEQRPERPWAISWLPDLQVRAHDKAQLRCVTSVPASVFSFPFSTFLQVLERGHSPKIIDLICSVVLLLRWNPTTVFCKTVPFRIDHIYGRSKKCRQRRHALGSNAWFVMRMGFLANNVYTVYLDFNTRTVS